MTLPFNELPKGSKVYFASDFHLGAPDYKRSRDREDRIIRWLRMASVDAQAIYLVGDVFDFWFEYKHVVPKGFVRILGELARIADSGIKLVLFTGNHDMWMFDYLVKEIGCEIHRDPISIQMGGHSFHIGHGDGLGPGDGFYKFLKVIFANKLCQRLFGFLHPWIGFSIAQKWSHSSRLYNDKKVGAVEVESEWLYAYCNEVEAKQHHDYYIFGHRHLPLDLKIGERARYINLGEWINFNTYAVYDGDTVTLKTFEG